MRLRDATLALMRKRGSDLLWLAAQHLAWPPDFSAADIGLCRAVSGKTMTSPERIVALAEAVRCVVANRVPGAIVECGVWRGGSMMAAALTLLELGERTRELVLYDTFEGMSAPGSRDVDLWGRRAEATAPHGSLTVREEEVAENVRSTGYPADRIRLVKGKVEETVPAQAPETIALLRLDTDWYESTRHELHHLWPRLSSGGVLVIDDYGAWQGARKAVDEFIAVASPRPLFVRLDQTGRCCLKP
jgi:O-methyltransferase